MRYDLEPGAEESQHFHLKGVGDSRSPGSSDEIYVVTLGEVVISSNDDRRVLRVGDELHAPDGVRHGIRNESDAPAELIPVFRPHGQLAFAQTGQEKFDMEVDWQADWPARSATSGLQASRAARRGARRR